MKSHLLVVTGILCISNYVLSMVPATYLSLHANVSVLASSQDGRYLVAGCSDGRVLIVDIYGKDQDSNFIVRPLTQVKSSVTAITCGTYIVIGCVSGDVYVFDYDQKLISSFHAHDGSIGILANDESWVAVTTLDNQVQVFDLNRPNIEDNPYCLCTLQSSLVIRAIALNHSRELLVYSDGCNIAVYDTQNKSMVTLNISNKQITSCCLNDTILWVSACDGYLRALDIISGKQINNFNTKRAFLSLSMSKDSSFLVGIDREKVVRMYNCDSGACVAEVHPNYAYIKTCALSGESVFFCQRDGDLEMQSIDSSLLFKNGLDCSIEEFIFVDESQQKHTIRKKYGAYDCARLVWNFLLDRYENYQICMKTSDSSEIVTPFLNLTAVKEMFVTRDINDAQLLLWLGKKCQKKDELKWTCCSPCICGEQTSAADQYINAMVYVWEEGVEGLSLQGSDSKEVWAKKRQDSPIWDFEGIGSRKPYVLAAETEKGRTIWQIPYLPNGSELFIPGNPNPKLLPNVYIVHEFTSQQSRLIYGTTEERKAMQTGARQGGKSSPHLWL